MTPMEMRKGCRITRKADTQGEWITIKVDPSGAALPRCCYYKISEATQERMDKAHGKENTIGEQDSKKK